MGLTLWYLMRNNINSMGTCYNLSSQHFTYSRLNWKESYPCSRHNTQIKSGHATYHGVGAMETPLPTCSVLYHGSWLWLDSKVVGCGLWRLTPDLCFLKESLKRMTEFKINHWDEGKTNLFWVSLLPLCLGLVVFLYKARNKCSAAQWSCYKYWIQLLLHRQTATMPRWVSVVMFRSSSMHRNR